MTKEENPQTQERDSPLSWKTQTPRFPHSHRTATAAVLASTPNQSHNHGLRYLLLYRLTHRFLGGSILFARLHRIEGLGRAATGRGQGRLGRSEGTAVG